jgi:hypothetical protein
MGIEPTGEREGGVAPSPQELGRPQPTARSGGRPDSHALPPYTSAARHVPLINGGPGTVAGRTSSPRLLAHWRARRSARSALRAGRFAAATPVARWNSFGETNRVLPSAARLLGLTAPGPGRSPGTSRRSRIHSHCERSEAISRNSRHRPVFSFCGDSSRPDDLRLTTRSSDTKSMTKGAPPTSAASP